MTIHDKTRDLIPSMYVSTAIAMIFTQLAGYGAVLIDGIITSRALGSLAYSAISLLGPFTGIVLLISNAFSVGAQVVSSQAVGRGEKDKANAAFTVSVLGIVIMSILLVIMCYLWPSELFKFCGITERSHPEIYTHMGDYLKGYMPGIPFMMLIQIMGPVIVVDLGKELFTLSALLFFGADITGDLLNAYVFHGGNYGMGLATSISYMMQFMMLITHFMRKNSYFQLSLRGFEASQIVEMTKAASPTFVLKLATALRDLVVNRINIYVAFSAAAIAARGIQTDTNTVLFCFAMGMGKTLLTMSAIFYGASDRRGMTRLLTCAAKMAVTVSGVISVITFICAEWIAGCFTSEPEVIDFATFSMRCMAIALVPDNLTVLFQHYLQGINERKLVNIINFASRFFIPVGTAAVLGYYYGSKGIMASMAASEIILLVFIVILVFMRTGTLRNFTLLSATFGGSDSDNIYASIVTMDDVLRESERAEKFCLEHGISPERAQYMSMFVEEMGGNILTHGKPKMWHRLRADYRLSLTDGKICMTLRDCCDRFDPSAFYETHKDDPPEGLIGLKLVMGLADDVRYFSAFNSNNIMVYIDAQKEVEADA